MHAAVRGDGNRAMMSTERRKMLSGELYDPLDPELVTARARARDLCQKLNATREAEEAERRRILRDLFGKGGDTVWMQPPFYLRLRDEHRTRRESLLQFQLHRARRVPGADRRLHALRASGADLYALASIQRRPTASRRVWEADRDWIGCVGRRRSDLLPGVSIGSRAVIGAGSVVTRDVPEGVVAAGNPCRVIRTITE